MGNIDTKNPQEGTLRNSILSWFKLLCCCSQIISVGTICVYSEAYGFVWRLGLGFSKGVSGLSLKRLSS